MSGNPLPDFSHYLTPGPVLARAVAGGPRTTYEPPSRRSKTTRPARFWASIILLLAAALSGCAPKLTGLDQVYDPNVAVTMQKDSGLAARTWNVVDSYMMSNVAGSADEPGCAIGIARAGQLVYLKGYGKAELGGDNWSVGTVGAVGSVAKTFTAAAALRMYELGLLDVNETVGDYLETPNTDLAAVRIHDLLDHSSGVGGATKGRAFAPNWEVPSASYDCQFNNDPNDAISCAQVRQLLARPALAFALYDFGETVAELDQGDLQNDVPSQGVYSNVGYSVAGAVIDAVATGTPSGGYEAWIWDHIGQYAGNLSGGNLLTLVLTHSWRVNDIPHRAVGYRPSGNGFAESEAFDQGQVGGIEGWEGPSGGWAMTIGDLTRFAVALNTKKIVGGTKLAAMRHHWTDLDAPANGSQPLGSYGMGTFLGEGGEPPYWHAGANRRAHRGLDLVGQSRRPVPGHRHDLQQPEKSVLPPGSRRHHRRSARLDQPGPDRRASALSSRLRVGGRPSLRTRRRRGVAAQAVRCVRGDEGAPPHAPHRREGDRPEDRGLASGRDGARLQRRAGPGPTGAEPRRGRLLDQPALRDSTHRRHARHRARCPSGQEVRGGRLVRSQGRGARQPVAERRARCRSVSSLGGVDHQSVCRDVVAAGARCEPCADGVVTCVTVEYRGVSGSRLSRSSMRP